MTMVVHCSHCSRPYRASDLSWVTIEPPHYEDLPEPSAENLVDERDDGTRVIRLYYCERCLDVVELPPVQPEPDLSVAPEPYHLGAGRDRAGGGDGE